MGCRMVRWPLYTLAMKRPSGGVRAMPKPKNKTICRISISFIIVKFWLNGGGAFFFGPNTHDFLDIGDEDFPVSNLAGLGRTDDGPHRALHAGIRENNLDLDLGQKIDFVLAAAIDFSVAFLASEAFDFAHRHAFDSYLT